MPTKPTNVTQNHGAVLIGSQRDTRYLDTYRDQHVWTKGPKAWIFGAGRPWVGYREFASERGAESGFVTAELQRGAFFGEADNNQSSAERERSLASAWDCPWYPESRFFEFNHRTKRIKLRYDRVIGEYTLAQRQYYQAAAKLVNQNGWTALTFGEVPPFQVTSVVGYPPPSPQIPQAAMAGDPWLLGFDEEPNPKILRLLGQLSISEGIYVATQPAVTPSATPEQVIAATPAQIQAMIDAAVKQALDKKDADKTRMEKVRAARAQAPSKPLAGVGVAE